MAGGKIDILIEPDAKGFGSKLDGSLKSQTSLLGSIGKGVGLALAAGTGLAAAGLTKVIELGDQYSANLNELQAVSGATANQMAAVSKTAIALGNDLSLPGTSAADAAQAMLELTKGGLSVDQAMTAAKGTLQLAAAATVDAGTAAELQSKALNEFGLSADQAGHVADVLANTANAAAGSVTDIGFALNYAGPVAKGFGITIDETAAALGLLANKGIQGEQAGTSLRGVLASLASPSKQASAALDELGIKAFDSQGKFEGLNALIGQLSTAQGHLTQAQFQSAAATAFGNEGLTTAVALASSGTKAFEDMQVAVGKQGGAADVAAAKMKGLGGAIEGFKSQAETLGIDIYQKISPGLEAVVRAGTVALGQLDGVITNALDDITAGAQTFGPAILAAVEQKASNIRDAGTKLLKPFVDGVESAAAEVLATVINLGSDISHITGNVIDGLRPVADAAGNVVKSLSQSGGVLNTASTGLEHIGSAASTASGALKPFGDLVGGALSVFASLPGPVQTAAVALVAFKLAQKALGDTNVPVVSGIKQFRDEMTLAQGQLRTVGGLAQNTGGTLRQFGNDLAETGVEGGQAAQKLSTLGAAAAAFETSTVPAVAAARNFRDQTVAIKEGAAAAGEPIGTMSAAIGTLVERSPALSAMRASFDEASGGARDFGSVAAGAVSAGATGIKTALGGVVSLLGGPVGIAITAATIGLSLLSQSDEKAAAAAKQHASAVDGLASALRDSNGAIDDNVRKTQAQAIQSSDSFKIFQAAGISLKDLTDISLGNSDAFDRVNGSLAATVGQTKLVANGVNGVQVQMGDQAVAAQAAQTALGDLTGQYGDAVKKNKDLQDAINGGTKPALTDFDQAMKNIATSGGNADTVLRNLKESFDDLTGKTLSSQQAQADFNQVISDATKSFDGLASDSRQFHDSLLAAGGAVNIATDNGRKLNDTLNQSKDGFDKVTKAAFDASRAQGDDLATSTQKAKDAAQAARDQFIAFATGALHLTSQEAQNLADKYGLIPNLVTTQITTPGMNETQAQLIQLKQKFDEQPNAKNITVTAPTDEAVQNLENLGFTVTHVPGSKDVTVTANTAGAVQALNDYIANNNGRTITVNVNLQGPGVQVAGQYVRNAMGSIVEHYAAGGLRPNMRGGYATVVAPNTWRVIGDRVRDDEAYIPINQSARSLGILTQTAARMGFDLVRAFAIGGVATAGGTAGSVTVTPGAPVFNQTFFPAPQQSSEEIARKAADRVAWDLRRRR